MITCAGKYGMSNPGVGELFLQRKIVDIFGFVGHRPLWQLLYSAIVSGKEP